MNERSAEGELNKILDLVQRFGTHELPMWYINILIFRFSTTVCSKSDLKRWSQENNVSCEFTLRQRHIGKRLPGNEEFVVFTLSRR
jgi:hypothetical protein